jgi:hypothetical protein
MGSNLPLKPINCIVIYAYQKFELIFVCGGWSGNIMTKQS